MSIAALGGLSAFEVLKRAIQDFSADSMTTYAAALAYRVVFSLFPFVLFLVALLAFLQIPELFEWMREQASLVVPAEAMGQVNSVIDELQTPRGGLVSIGILLALWSASVGVMSLIEALNVAYDVAERRPTWRLYLLSLLYTVGLAVNASPAHFSTRYAGTVLNRLDELGLDPDMSGVTKGSNVVAYWGVADARAAHQRVQELGAANHSDPQDVGGGIIVATVTDPFGNVFGIIENPHFKL